MYLSKFFLITFSPLPLVATAFYYWFIHNPGWLAVTEAEYFSACLQLSSIYCLMVTGIIFLVYHDKIVESKNETKYVLMLTLKVYLFFLYLPYKLVCAILRYFSYYERVCRTKRL